jgi:CHAD domain-containing protein
MVPDKPQAESLADALRRIATEQITAAIADLSSSDADRDEQIHLFRKRCKKLRGLLRLIGSTMGGQFDDEDALFRDASGLLGRARDAAVSDAKLWPETRMVPTVRQQAQPIDVTAETIRACIDIMSRAQIRVDSWPLDNASAADIRQGFEETYRKFRRAYRRARKKPSNHRYHKVRKWAKYHCHQVRLLEYADSESFGEHLERLLQLDDALGDAHDLAVILAARASDPVLSGQRRRKLVRQNATLLKRADKYLKQVTRRKPKALGKEFEGHLQAWPGSW